MDHTSIIKAEILQLETAFASLNLDKESAPANFINSAITSEQKQLDFRSKLESEVVSLTENSDEKVYAYQISTGENIYLHPINFKCLIDQFGDPKNMPKIIKGNILEIESYQYTEDEIGRAHV